MGLAQQFYVPILRTLAYYIVQISLNLLVKEIGIDRQVRPPIAAGSRYRYAIPHPLDRPVSSCPGCVYMVRHPRGSYILPGIPIAVPGSGRTENQSSH